MAGVAPVCHDDKRPRRSHWDARLPFSFLHESSVALRHAALRAEKSGVTQPWQLGQSDGAIVASLSRASEGGSHTRLLR